MAREFCFLGEVFFLLITTPYTRSHWIFLALYCHLLQKEELALVDEKSPRANNIVLANFKILLLIADYTKSLIY